MTRHNGAIILALLLSSSRPLTAFVASPITKCISSLQYSTDGVGNQVKESSEKVTASEELVNLYRTVAEQDPEWYTNFVVNVLGEETVKRNGLPLKGVSTPIKAAIMPTKPSAQDSVVVEEALAEMSNETTAERENIVSPEQSTTSEMFQREEPEPEPDTNISSVAYVEPSKSDVDLVVVYQDDDRNLQTVPFANLAALGYNPDDVKLLQSDVVALVVADRVRKPHAGVPLQWQAPVFSTNSQSGESTCFRVQIVPPSQAELLRNEAADNARQPAANSRLNRVDDDTNATSTDEAPFVEEPTSLKTETKISISLDSSQSSSSQKASLKIQEKQAVEIKDQEDTPKATLVSEEKSLPDSAAVGSRLGTTPDKKESKDDDSVNEQVVLYKDFSSNALLKNPLKTFVALGYSKNEISELQSDVVSVIAADRVCRPQAGIPPQWKAGGGLNGVGSTTRDVRVVKESDADTIIISDLKTRKQASARIESKRDPLKNDNAVSKHTSLEPESGKGSRTQRDSQDTTLKDENSNEKLKALLSGSAKRINTEDSKSRPDSAPSEDSIEEVVVYRDSSIRGPLLVALKNLTALGYSIDEIKQLRSEVVSLIISDRISRPRGGLPPQWRSRKSRDGLRPDGIQVLSMTEAEGLVERAKNRLRSGEERSRGKVKDGDRDLIDPSRRERRSSVERTSEADGNSKKIYSGRENKARKKTGTSGDPPPPKSPLWPDIATFRGLLRKEAELRLRLLGDDWAGVVKDESDWRLGLYRDWLWTLEKGIGNPIVPERTRPKKANTYDRPENRSSRNSNDPRPRRKP